MTTNLHPSQNASDEQATSSTRQKATGTVLTVADVQRILVDAASSTEELMAAHDRMLIELRSIDEQIAAVKDTRRRASDRTSKMGFRVSIDKLMDQRADLVGLKKQLDTRIAASSNTHFLAKAERDGRNQKWLQDNETRVTSSVISIVTGITRKSKTAKSSALKARMETDIGALRKIQEAAKKDASGARALALEFIRKHSAVVYAHITGIDEWTEKFVADFLEAVATIS